MSANASRRITKLLARGSWAETSRISDILRKEAVGGALLLVASAVALVWSNSPWSSTYEALRDTPVGADVLGLHLTLTLGTWAADGLLAIFFFVVGLELKREFVAGDLRDPARAALPIAAAVGGMIVPAAIFIATTAHVGDGATRGWAIPTAPDIAFAVAVLTMISTPLPARSDLPTDVAIVDHLFVTVLTFFYTTECIVGSGRGIRLLAVFTVCVRRQSHLVGTNTTWSPNIGISARIRRDVNVAASC